ncbi:MAG TPA: polynucleotide adenylyltransferase PcnB [Candidatus Binataceae bacterium]|nr:polynucleotide adenylyltransferase PcnB [Candidatus Binataceae bacterium]
MEPFVLERPEHPVSRRDIDPNVLKVLYRLINANHTAYLVGGGVRDLMVGRQPKDFDVATSAHPHEIRTLFRNSRLIGRRFRLVHVFFGAKNIEVATFRRRGEEADAADPMIRHDNTFGTPEEDAFRRDFTVNSLFYDPRSFQVIDFAGGVRDLRERLIRTIGEPELRMREDPVRMIRAVRLAAKLDFEIEPMTRAAIESCADDLAKASVARLVEEVYRTLSLSNSARALILMQRLGLLQSSLPVLSAHLSGCSGELESTPTVRTLKALGESLTNGSEPPRGFLLACLFADLHIAETSQASEASGPDICTRLRTRGYSRADTEQMRLLLDALTHMLKPSRITRRIMRRPYFPLARRLFDLTAPILGVDPSELERFLSTPPGHQPAGSRRRHLPHPAADGAATAPSRRSRRRRGHRGGRGRNRLGPRAGDAAAAEASVHPGGELDDSPATAGSAPPDDYRRHG